MCILLVFWKLLERFILFVELLLEVDEFDDSLLCFLDLSNSCLDLTDKGLELLELVLFLV